MDRDILIIIAFGYPEFPSLELQSAKTDIPTIRSAFPRINEVYILTDLPPNELDPNVTSHLVRNCLDIYTFFRNLKNCNGKDRVIIYYSGHLDPNGLTITKDLSFRMDFLKKTICSTFGTRPRYLFLFDCCGNLELKLDFFFDLTSNQFILRDDYTGGDSQYKILLMASTSCGGKSLALSHSFFTWAFSLAVNSQVKKLTTFQIEIQASIDDQIVGSGSLEMQNFTIYSSQKIVAHLEPWIS